MSRPILRGVGYFGRPVARKREAWRVGCSRCANTRAHAERGGGEGEGEGEPREADRGGLAGGGGAYSWCVLLVHTTPPPGSAGGQRERGGEPPAGRVGLAGGGGYLFLVVTLLPLGACGGAGAWCFPLGGGLGLVVTISLGSVKGGGLGGCWVSVDNRGGGVGWLVSWFWLGFGLVVWVG